MGNCYSLYSKNLGMSGKMVWWSTEPNWSTKLGDLLECLKLTLHKTRIYTGSNKVNLIFTNHCLGSCKRFAQCAQWKTNYNY